MSPDAEQPPSAEEKPRKREKTVFPDWYVGGPHGVGDPNDRRLRKVEKDVLIPKIIRERSQKVFVLSFGIV